MALVGVLLMCIVTTKTMSQVMEQMFHPRLREVHEATTDLKVAEADLSTLSAKRGSADKALEPLQERVDNANERIAELNRNIETQGKAPSPIKKQECWIGRKTKKRFCKDIYVPQKWVGQQFADQLDAAYDERDAAVAARHAAAASVAVQVEQIADQDKHVTELRNAQREAVGIAAAFVYCDGVRQGPCRRYGRRGALVPALLRACAS